MYQAYWGLREPPFRGNLDPKSFYQSPTHEEALARLNFLVEQHHRLGLLIGPGGSGKSLLFEVFAQQLRRQGRSVAKLSLLDVEPAEMLSLLADRMGIGGRIAAIGGRALAGLDRPADREPLSATGDSRAAGRRRSGRRRGCCSTSTVWSGSIRRPKCG